MNKNTQSQKGGDFLGQNGVNNRCLDLSGITVKNFDFCCKGITITRRQDVQKINSDC